MFAQIRAFSKPALAAALLAALAPGSTRAETPADASDAGRYSMTPAPGGFLRLDQRTGAVSLCTVSGDSAVCRAAADDRAALADEIDRLAKRNAELEQRGPSPLRNALPSREDMCKALDFAEDFMRRMMRVMKSDDAGGRNHI